MSPNTSHRPSEPPSEDTVRAPDGRRFYCTAGHCLKQEITMFKNKSAAVLFGGLLVSTAVFCGRAAAENPETTLRYFALVLPPGATPDDIPNLCPDLQDPASKLLVVHPPGNDINPWGLGLIFMSNSARMSGEPAETTYECDGTTYERGETWVLARDVTLASAGGGETVTLLWKDELPPAGALAFAGPISERGTAMFFDWFWVRSGEPSDTDNVECNPYVDHYIASKERSNNARLWCIAAGLFTK
jgi:hypothetical protein